MMHRAGIVALCCMLNAVPLFAQTLDQVLRSTQVGATSFADYILADPPLVIPPGAVDLVIYAPNNLAMQKFFSGTHSRRQTNGTTSASSTDQKNVQVTASRQQVLIKRALSTGGSVINTQVVNSASVNLGPNVPLALVAKPGDNANEQVISSGLGSTSNVLAGEYTFDQGVVRLVDDVFTLPQAGGFSPQTAGFSTFPELFASINITDILNDTPGVTVLIPTDDAFQTAKPWLDLLAPWQLREVLLYHILESYVGYSPDLQNGTWHKTIEGSYIFTRIYDDTIYMNDGVLLEGDAILTNGVAQVLDRVLIPPSYDWTRAYWGPYSAPGSYPRK
ncbi:hypothetical protein RUND412_009225 [Rhizina undulata]